MRQFVLLYIRRRVVALGGNYRYCQRCYHYRQAPPTGRREGRGRSSGGAAQQQCRKPRNNAASRGAALLHCYTCLEVVRVAIRESVCV